MVAAGEAEPAPYRDEGVRERDESANPPPTSAAAAAAVVVKTVGVGTSPTAKSQARGQSAENSGRSSGVRKSVGVGTSPSRTSEHTSPVASPTTNPRATTPRSKIASHPLLSFGAIRQQARTKGGDRSESASSFNDSSTSAAAGDAIFEGQGEFTLPASGDNSNNSCKATGKNVEPTSNDLEATLLVEFCRQSGEKAGGEEPTTNGFAATVVMMDVSAAENGGGGGMVPASSSGHQPRNKKRNRVTPLGTGNINSQPTGEVVSIGVEGGGSSSTTGRLNTDEGDRQSLSGGSSAHRGVVHEKKLSDAGVQLCARPAETSKKRLAGGLGSGRCGCLVM